MFYLKSLTQHRVVHNLDLSGSIINNRNITALLELIAHQKELSPHSLKVLNLSNTQLTDTLFIKLLAVLKEHHIRKIDLSNNKLSKISFALLENLKNLNRQNNLLAEIKTTNAFTADLDCKLKDNLKMYDYLCKQHFNFKARYKQIRTNNKAIRRQIYRNLNSDQLENNLQIHDIFQPKHTQNQLKYTLQGHTGWVRSLCQMSENILVSGSDDKEIKVWDLTTNTCIGTIKKGKSECNKKVEVSKVEVKSHLNPIKSVDLPSTLVCSFA